MESKNPDRPVKGGAKAGPPISYEELEQASKMKFSSPPTGNADPVLNLHVTTDSTF